MIVGFTGTKLGLTLQQHKALRELFASFEASELHHGDCVGADERAAYFAQQLSWHIVIHPPSDPKLRAFCSGDETLQEKPYIQRNHDIVDACELLVATPQQNKEELRSGTWATVRYARKKAKPIVFVFPDGSCKIEVT